MTEPVGRHERLVFLHGFTQTHHHWHRVAHLIADRLAGRTTLAFVDLPGHGLSGDDRTGIADSAAALATVGGAGTYVGYSMGGRFALVAAAAGSVALERVVLIGATPGIDDTDARSERSRLDDDRATRVEQLGVEAFLDEWLAAPMFARLPPDPAGLEHRRRNSSAGLAHSLRTCGTASQGSLWSSMSGVTVPVLVIAGERDEKFTAIGRRLADALPTGTFAAIPDAGHAAHTEQPAAVADTIAGWLG